MKNKLLCALTLTALISLSACEKKAVSTNCELVAVKRLRSDCDRIIFKVLSNDFNGDATWTDFATGQQHTNVVAMINPCRFNSFPYPDIQRRDTFYVKIKQLPDNNPPIVGEACGQCLALSNNPPKTQVDFTLIDFTTCEY